MTMAWTMACTLKTSYPKALSKTASEDLKCLDSCSMNECLLKVEVDSSWRCARLVSPKRISVGGPQRAEVGREAAGRAGGHGLGSERGICLGAHLSRSPLGRCARATSQCLRSRSFCREVMHVGWIPRAGTGILGLEICRDIPVCLCMCT